MSEGATKAEDKMNMVGIVVVGICGAVLVYVSIVLLEAFYMNDTSEVNVMADYGGQDTDAKSVKASQQANITTPSKGGSAGSFHISIDHAIELVAAEGHSDPSNLIPSVGKSEKATIQPVFGRPQPLGAPAAGSGAGSGSGSGSAAGSGSGSAATPPPAEGAGSGSGSNSGSGSAAGSSAAGAPAAPAAAAPQPTTGNAPAAGVAGSPAGAGAASGSAAPAAGSGGNGK